eukprot:COSAG06_NODE_17863_length_917_cov_0.872861_1_plen_203_part_10
MEPAPHESVPPPDSAVRDATAAAATGAPGGGRRGSLDTGMVPLWAKGAKTAATVGLAVASKMDAARSEGLAATNQLMAGAEAVEALLAEARSVIGGRTTREFDVTYGGEGTVGMNLKARDERAEKVLVELVPGSLALRQPQLQEIFTDEGRYRQRGVLVFLVAVAGESVEDHEFSPTLDRLRSTPRPLTVTLRVSEPSTATLT